MCKNWFNICIIVLLSGNYNTSQAPTPKNALTSTQKIVKMSAARFFSFFYCRPITSLLIIYQNTEGQTYKSRAPPLVAMVTLNANMTAMAENKGGGAVSHTQNQYKIAWQ